MKQWKAWVYWIVTGGFAALMLLSAAFYLAGTVQSRETMAHLGYPPYILWILGPAKLLGVFALLQNRWPRLKEWAYAGFAIDLIGASASHFFTGDPVGQAVFPLLLLLPLSASDALRPDLQGVAARHHTTATQTTHKRGTQFMNHNPNALTVENSALVLIDHQPALARSPTKTL